MIIQLLRCPIPLLNREIERFNYPSTKLPKPFSPKKLPKRFFEHTYQSGQKNRA
jgi:hypothetical protein